MAFAQETIYHVHTQMGQSLVFYEDFKEDKKQ